jgi:hypothetical protein
MIWPAVAALWHLPGNPCLLDGVQAVRPGKTLYGCNHAAGNSAHRCYAGTYGITVHMHRTGTALGNAAAKFGAGETKVFANDPQQWCFSCHLDGMLCAVNVQVNHGMSSLESKSLTVASLAEHDQQRNRLPVAAVLLSAAGSALVTQA